MDGWIHATHCILHAATYTTQVQYKNNLPNITTTIVRHEQIYSSISAELESMKAGMAPVINRTANLVNFYAVEQAIQALLTGDLINSHAAGDNIIGTGQLPLWKFLDFTSPKAAILLPFPDDFSQKVEDLLINTTLSLTYFLDHPNLAREDNYSFSGQKNVPIAVTTMVDATTTTLPPRYNYSATTLWEIYGVSLGISTVCMAFGWYMLFRNGMDSELSFSQVLVTTRNKSLDRLCYGACLGGETIPKELRRTKLKYGELIDQDGNFDEDERVGDEMHKHACFGLEDEVTFIKRKGYT
jgi:hypothetical protein